MIRNRRCCSKARPGCGLTPNAADVKPEKFWNEVSEYPEISPPPTIAEALIATLPAGIVEKVRLSRVPARAAAALGRPRYVAIAYWRGGQVLREAKALVPSAWAWAHGHKNQKSNFLELANGRYRAPDPLSPRAETSSSSGASAPIPTRSSSVMMPV